MNRQEIGNAINSQLMAKKSQLLNEYIVYAFNKYKDPSFVIVALSQYIGGSETSITRDRNFRTLFKDNLSFQDILTISNNDLVTYVNGVLQVYQNNIQASNNKAVDDFEMFIEGVKATYKNAAASDFNMQDPTYAYRALIFCLDNLSNGFFNVMTNDNGYRDYFTQKYSQQELQRLVNEFENRIMSNSTMRVGKNFTEQVALQLYYGYNFGELNKYNQSVDDRIQSR